MKIQILCTLGPASMHPEIIRELGDQVVLVAQAIGALIGIVMTIWGRTRASASLERRQVTFQL